MPIFVTPEGLEEVTDIVDVKSIIEDYVAKNMFFEPYNARRAEHDLSKLLNQTVDAKIVHDEGTIIYFYLSEGQKVYSVSLYR
jgi:hypothetical protein